MARLQHAMAARFASASIGKMEPRRVGRVIAHHGGIIEAEGLTAPIGTALRLVGKHASVAAEVTGFAAGRTIIVPLARDAAILLGDRVELTGQSDQIGCGPALLGRVIGALGEPLDGAPPAASTMHWPLNGHTANPLARGRVVEPFDVGVRVINALLTVGVGQRIALIAGSGVGKSVLMGQMLAGADCDVIVIGLIGERAREVSDFVETKLAGDVRKRAVVVAVPADHPPLLRLRAAMRATAIAEGFRSQGKRVLLLIDSLTRIAHAQREIGLQAGEPPTMKGYPPSALSLIPGLVERAGRDVESGGSITAIYTVLADGGDLDDPVVDAARAIVDGHFILSRSLAEEGVYPALDIRRSLSRTMADVVDDDHTAAASQFRRLWSVYEENRDLMLMGAYQEGADPTLDEAVARRGEMLDLIRQPYAVQVPFDAARAALITEFGA
jgi:flagellum-specific ATP synthase